MLGRIIGGVIVLSLGIISADSAAGESERMVFVRDGEPIAVYGGAVRSMRHEGDALLLLGPEHDSGEWGHTLLADAALHQGAFKIRARLTLEKFDGSGVSSLMGGHYHNNRDPQAGRRVLRISLDDASDGCPANALQDNALAGR